MQSYIWYESLTTLVIFFYMIIQINEYPFLADSAIESSTRLEFKQRLSIALGAAKGDSHYELLYAEKFLANWRMLREINHVYPVQVYVICMA